MIKALFILALLPWAVSAIPSFPGAQGYGAVATGGRSGAVIGTRTYDSRVIHVTNLNSSGAGSLTAALAAGGPRYVVFDVSGVIDCQQTNILISSYVTVAGQTSPGGITIVNGGLVARPTTTTNLFLSNWQCTQDIIIRHLRVRSGRYWGGDDNIRLGSGNRAIVDHCSFTCPCDENVDLQNSSNITFSWCILADGNRGCDGELNQKAILASSTHQHSCFLTLFAHFNKRAPMYSNCYGGCVISSTHYEVVNNVLYNCGREETFPDNNGSFFNVEGNYLKSGLDNTYSSGSPNAWISSGSMTVYSAGNHNPALPSLTQSQFIAGSPTYVQARLQPQYTSARTAQQAYTDVLAQAGALPHDSLDRRVVREVQTGTGHLRELSSLEINQGKFITREPLTLPAWSKPTDADKDGMADAWELRQGLNPADSLDFRTSMNGGYEAIEVYINELADSLAAFGRWPSYVAAENDPLSGKFSMSLVASPNPFRTGTRISFTGFNTQNPELQILDLKGRVVERVSGQEGNYSWTARNRPAGIYIARLKAQGGTFTLPLYLIN